MTPIDILIKLETKWGHFEPIEHALCNKKMPFVSNKAYLNILYKPHIDATKKTFETLNANIPPKLLDFYQNYNGCRLLFSSLNIFGVQCHENELYEPFDLEFENNAIQTTFKDDNYIFFGSLGGEYVFAYKKDECSKIYVIKKGERQILKTFNSFDSWFSYYFDFLYNEYDEIGQKIHPNKEHEKIPILYHLTYKFF